VARTNDQADGQAAEQIPQLRIFDHNFVEHAQKIALIVVVAAIWIAFQTQGAAPQASADKAQGPQEAPAVSREAEMVVSVPFVAPTSDAADPLLALPVKGIRPTELYDSFSDKRSGGRRHEAIDIIADLNTPVLAARDGRIARLENNPRGGLSIYQLDPREQFVYYYAHLAGYAGGLEEGDSVRRGQVIGRVGQSGNAQTPHLHFAILRVEPGRWWSGEAINPYPLLAVR